MINKELVKLLPDYLQQIREHCGNKKAQRSLKHLKTKTSALCTKRIASMSQKKKENQSIDMTNKFLKR